MHKAVIFGSMFWQLAWSLSAMAAEPALTLSEAWRLAMRNDPGYQAAVSEREAGLTHRTIGRAGLLPQISSSLGLSRVHGTLETPGACGPSCTDLDYMSRTGEIRATQTVFNWSRIAEYRQGQARADQSLAVFDSKAGSSALRLVNRYFQALLAHEYVMLAKAKLVANEKQAHAAERRFEGGDGTLSEVREARSRRDLARANVIKAGDEAVVSRRELQEMLGQAPGQLTLLKHDVETRPILPGTEAEWLAIAKAGNPDIRSAEQRLRVAGHAIDLAFGGHLPTLDLVAARRSVDAETVATRDQSSNTTAIGVQLSLPIYSGGLVAAQVEQARHNYDSLAQELAAARERVAVDVTRQYQGIVTGAQHIEALVQAVASGEEALKATGTGYRLGMRTILDVLDAEDRLFQSRLDLTQARLQYAVAHLSLAAAAGQLDAAMIGKVDAAYFGTEK